MERESRASASTPASAVGTINIRHKSGRSGNASALMSSKGTGMSGASGVGGGKGGSGGKGGGRGGDGGRSGGGKGGGGCSSIDMAAARACVAASRARLHAQQRRRQRSSAARGGDAHVANPAVAHGADGDGAAALTRRVPPTPPARRQRAHASCGSAQNVTGSSGCTRSCGAVRSSRVLCCRSRRTRQRRRCGYVGAPTAAAQHATARTRGGVSGAARVAGSLLISPAIFQMRPSALLHALVPLRTPRARFLHDSCTHTRSHAVSPAAPALYNTLRPRDAAPAPPALLLPAPPRRARKSAHQHALLSLARPASVLSVAAGGAGAPRRLRRPRLAPLPRAAPPPPLPRAPPAPPFPPSPPCAESGSAQSR